MTSLTRLIRAYPITFFIVFARLLSRLEKQLDPGVNSVGRM